MPNYMTFGGASSVGANGSDTSVSMAQEGLQNSMNKAMVQQAQMMEKQTIHQLNQQKISSSQAVVNSTKELTDKVRL